MNNETIKTNSLVVVCDFGTLFIPKGSASLDGDMLVVDKYYKQREYHYRSGSTGMFSEISYYSRKGEKTLYIKSYSFEIVIEPPVWAEYSSPPTNWDRGKKHNEFKTEIDYKRENNLREWKSLPWWKRIFSSPKEV